MKSIYSFYKNNFYLVGGIHGDVKPENFVVLINQSLNSNVIDCKLIDFNYSVLTGQGIPDNLKHPIRRAEDISFVLNKAPEIGRDEVIIILTELKL